MAKREIVHLLVVKEGLVLPLNTGGVRTRCGKVACPVSGTPSRYQLSDEHGNQFQGTTRRKCVTCKKCVNLITRGTIHERP